MTLRDAAAAAITLMGLSFAGRVIALHAAAMATPFILSPQTFSSNDPALGGDACESGQGWAGCRHYCQPGATFSAQADALTGVDTLQAYTEWVKGLFMTFEGDKIRHMTKIWNDVHSLRQLGWM